MRFCRPGGFFSNFFLPSHLDKPTEPNQPNPTPEAADASKTLLFKPTEPRPLSETHLTLQVKPTEPKPPLPPSRNQ